MNYHLQFFVPVVILLNETETYSLQMFLVSSFKEWWGEAISSQNNIVDKILKSWIFGSKNGGIERCVECWVRVKLGFIPKTTFCIVHALTTMLHFLKQWVKLFTHFFFYPPGTDFYKPLILNLKNVIQSTFCITIFKKG